MSRLFSPTRPLLLCFAALLSSCDAEDLSAPSSDEAQGRFEYRCVQASDAFDPCGQENAFPETVAVGAEFEIHFRGEGDVAHQVVSAAPEKLASLQGNRFKVQSSGPLAVLAMGTGETRDIRVVDFLHLNAKPVERIGLRDVSGDEDLSSLRMVTGQVRNLIARPYAAGTKQVAAGALPYRWDSSDPSIVTLEALPNSRTIGLVARRKGAAVITVFQGEVERSIDVTVLGQVPTKKDKE